MSNSSSRKGVRECRPAPVDRGEVQDDPAVAFYESAKHRTVAVSLSAKPLRPGNQDLHARTPDQRQPGATCGSQYPDMPRREPRASRNHNRPGGNYGGLAIDIGAGRHRLHHDDAAGRLRLCVLERHDTVQPLG